MQQKHYLMLVVVLAVGYFIGIKWPLLYKGTI